MKLKHNNLLNLALAMAWVVPIVFMAGIAGAMYLTDGTKEVSPGVYENPNDGMCIVGVAANGDMLVDNSITNARDCVAYTTGLTGMTTQAACQNAGGPGNDGYRHTWSTSNICINAANPSVAISLEGLDRTLAMCQSKGGTTLTSTGTCVAYGWVYRNRKADGTVPAVAGAPATTKGITSADNLGFCYAPVRMTMTGVNNTALTCPSINNLGKYCVGGTNDGTACSTNANCTGGGTCFRNTTTWPDCDSNLNLTTSTSAGCQTQAAYDAGLGWSFASGQCIYAYGVNGFANAAITRVNGTTYAAGAAIMPANYTTQGDCLSQGFSWDNWLPVGATTLVAGYNTNLGPSSYRKFDTATPVANGGGLFHSGTGAVCTKCHSDQSRAYVERYKAGFIESRHKKAGDDPSKPWAEIFGEATSPWGIKGVQCNICHGTARPGQNDLLQVSSSTATLGLPKYASGHQNLALGSAATQLCFECHGAPSGGVSNPASVIPTAAGEFSVNAAGLAPIANQFLNSPHARYTGDSQPLSILTKANYGSTFVGFNCRTAANGTSYLTTVYQNGQVGLIHFLDSLTNGDCTNAGDGSASSGAAGIWQREGSNTDSATAIRTDQGNCTTCHDVHWSLGSTNPDAEPLRRECTTCHSEPAAGGYDSASGAAQITFVAINHPAVPGSPLVDENGVLLTGKAENHACETCHMPKQTAAGSFMHLFRINTDPSYKTIDGSGLAGIDADGRAWVDLDSSCGQCHGPAGSAHLMSSGGISSFAAFMHIPGSGAPSTVCSDCHVRSLAHPTGANTPSACLDCHGTTRPGVKPAVMAACITCHATNGPAQHKFTAAQLTTTAAAIHAGGSAPSCTDCHTSNPTVFINHPKSPSGWKPTCADCHKVAGVSPTVATACNPCHGGSAGRTAVKPGVPYLSAYTLGIQATRIHRNTAPVAAMRLVATDRKPNVAGKQVWIGDTVQVTDISTDASGDLTTIKVLWGDGNVSTIAPGGTATHIYSRTGEITIRLRAIDSKGLVKGVSRVIYVRRAPAT